MPAIEVQDLAKHFPGFRGGVTALRGISFEVPEGGVFGFLGPNGSGKTTTIRCLLDLVRPTSGEARVLGARSRGELAQVVSRIGAIVETPTFFPRFSARRNLEYLARLAGMGRKEVMAALESVGLGGREKDLVRNFSLGMKQRLGLAAALVKDPELLILDEPAHGLDPAGINEVRRLLRRLGDEGRTVFLSSHLLSEVQAICDRVAILHRGNLVSVGSTSEVLARGPAAVLVRVNPLKEALEVLDGAGFEASVDRDTIRVSIAPDRAARVTEALASSGLYPYEVRPVETTLEEVFLEITSDKDSGPSRHPGEEGAP